LIPITFFRSSSYNTWDFCEQDFFISYVLKFKKPAHHKATHGNISHKALELLAKKKLATQNGKNSFKDDEIGEFQTNELTLEKAIKVGFDYYSKIETSRKWNKEDFDICDKYFRDAITKWNGAFNPLNRKIIAPEQYFEFVFPYEWAKYDFDGKDGYLGIKGTIDLVTEIAPGILEYIDWKTGRRFDWAKEKIKEYQDLKNDPQLRIYYYAIRKLYPKHKIVMTIVFIKDGGPFTIPFDDSDLKKTEDMLRQRFEEIKKCKRPKPNKTWKCKAFCPFSKEYKKSGKSICDHFRDETADLGIDKVIEKYADKDKIDSYGSAAGTNR